LETGLIETEWALNAANGQKVSLHQKQIIFKSGSGIVVITFSTIRDATVDLTPDFDKLIESLQLLD
jgi:hypothetical protein